MTDWLMRTEALLGEEKLKKLQQAKVAVLGLGGVGSAAAEALCRAGIGHLLLVDHDEISVTNLNRQLIATTKNIGREKCQAMKERLLEINPNCEIEIEKRFYLPQESAFLYEYQPNAVVDAVDTVTAKIHLAKCCQERGIPLFAALGTGNRLDPTKLKTGDIYETAGIACPLARIMRRELRKAGVSKLTVVYSTETPQKIVVQEEAQTKRHPPASSAFVPPVAGYFLASAVVFKILA